MKIFFKNFENTYITFLNRRSIFLIKIWLISAEISQLGFADRERHL